MPLVLGGIKTSSINSDSTCILSKLNNYQRESFNNEISLILSHVGSYQTNNWSNFANIADLSQYYKTFAQKVYDTKKFILGLANQS